jgi:hypothetical protein
VGNGALPVGGVERDLDRIKTRFNQSADVRPDAAENGESGSLSEASAHELTEGMLKRSVHGQTAAGPVVWWMNLMIHSRQFWANGPVGRID